MVTDDDGGDMEYIFPGSDDDFDAEDLQEEYDRVNREQSGQDLDETMLQSLGCTPEFDIPGPSGSLDSCAQGSHLDLNEPMLGGRPDVSTLDSPLDSNTASSNSGTLPSSRGAGGCRRTKGRPKGHQQYRGRGRTRGRGRGQQRPGEEEEDSEWSSEPADVVVEDFTQPVGPTIPLGDYPLETFVSLFTPALLERIVEETNRYASLCLVSTHVGDGPPPTWKTSGAEIMVYLGFCILMGLNKVPDLYDYWSLSPVFHYFPVASRIPRKRFLEIQRFLHLRDNDSIIPHGQPGYDHLAKVRPILDALKESFLSSYQPSKENSIDEAMIKFKGRSSLKQYLPKKPIKCGFKVWVQADSNNGYVCDLNVYTGSAGSPEQNLGEKVVKSLSRPLVGGHYHLYYDNFFSSVALCDDLLEDGLYSCSTFRKDRKGVPEVMKTVPGKHKNIHARTHMYQLRTHTETIIPTHGRTHYLKCSHTQTHAYRHIYTHVPNYVHIPKQVF